MRMRWQSGRTAVRQSRLGDVLGRLSNEQLQLRVPHALRLGLLEGRQRCRRVLRLEAPLCILVHCFRVVRLCRERARHLPESDALVEVHVGERGLHGHGSVEGFHRSFQPTHLID